MSGAASHASMLFLRVILMSLQGFRTWFCFFLGHCIFQRFGYHGPVSTAGRTQPGSKKHWLYLFCVCTWIGQSSKHWYSRYKSIMGWRMFTIEKKVLFFWNVGNEMFVHRQTARSLCSSLFPPSIIIGPVGVGRIREAASCKLIAKWALFRFHYSPAGSTINCRLISFGGGEIKQCATFCHCVVCSSSFVQREMVKEKKQ